MRNVSHPPLRQFAEYYKFLVSIIYMVWSNFLYRSKIEKWCFRETNTLEVFDFKHVTMFPSILNSISGSCLFCSGQYFSCEFKLFTFENTTYFTNVSYFEFYFFLFLYPPHASFAYCFCKFLHICIFVFLNLMLSASHPLCDRSQNTTTLKQLVALEKLDWFYDICFF